MVKLRQDSGRIWQNNPKTTINIGRKPQEKFFFVVTQEDIEVWDAWEWMKTSGIFLSDHMVNKWPPTFQTRSFYILTNHSKNIIEDAIQKDISARGVQKN